MNNNVYRIGIMCCDAKIIANRFKMLFKQNEKSLEPSFVFEKTFYLSLLNLNTLVLCVWSIIIDHCPLE